MQQHTPYQLCPKCLGEATVPTPNSTSVNGVCPVCNGGRIIPMFAMPDETTNKEKWRFDGLLTHDGVLITDVDQTIFYVSVNGHVCEALTLRIIYLCKKYIKGKYLFFSTNEARERWVGYMKEIKSTVGTPTERPEVENRIDIITEDGVVNPAEVYIVYLKEIDFLGQSAKVRIMDIEYYRKIKFTKYTVPHKIFSSELLAENYIKSCNGTNTEPLSSTESAGIAALMDMPEKVDKPSFMLLTGDGVVVKGQSQIIYGVYCDDTYIDVDISTAFSTEAKPEQSQTPLYFSTPEARTEYTHNRRIAKVRQHKIDTYLEEVERSFDKIISALRSQGV